jgi:hypothetical protein
MIDFFKVLNVSMMEHPQPYILTDESGHLFMEPKMKTHLENSPHPLVVVAVTGIYRTGKSYLLNRLMGRQDGFPLGSTVQSKTKGIWAWISKHPRFPDRLLLLLDTEGLSDPEKDNADHDIWIFSLSLLLSSVFVYNSKGVIDNEALEKLHMVAELTEHLRVKSGGAEDGEEFHKFFPDFIWAVRDFFLKCEIDGKEVSATEYMEWHLRLKRGKSKETMRSNSIRSSIQSFFDNRLCFLFPFPVEQDKLQDLDHVPHHKLNPGFREIGEQFVEHILSKETTKTIYGKAVTGRMFSLMVETYLKTIRDGAIPSVETAVDYMAATENRKAKELAIEAYRKDLADLKLPVPNQMLHERDSRAKQIAVVLFLDRALFDKNDEGSVALGLELNENFNNLTNKNTEASIDVASKALDSLYAPIKAKIQRGDFLKAKGYSDYKKEMENLVAKYTAISMLGDEADNVMAKFKEDRETESRQIMEADQRLGEEQRRTEEQRKKKEKHENKISRQRDEIERMENEQRKLEKDHEENMRRFNIEMTKKSEEEKGELQMKINKDNKRHEELVRNGFQQEAAQLQARLQGMQNNLAKKVSGLL